MLGHLSAIGAEALARWEATTRSRFSAAIRELSPDHLLIALRAGERTGWQEGRLLDRIQERFAIPVSVFTR